MARFLPKNYSTDPVLLASDFRCAYCGRDLLENLETFVTFARDHVLPCRRGGACGGLARNPRHTDEADGGDNETNDERWQNGSQPLDEGEHADPGRQKCERDPHGGQHDPSQAM